jgi:hypothetical protein
MFSNSGLLLDTNPLQPLQYSCLGTRILHFVVFALLFIRLRQLSRKTARPVNVVDGFERQWVKPARLLSQKFQKLFRNRRRIPVVRSERDQNFRKHIPRFYTDYYWYNDAAVLYSD